MDQYVSSRPRGATAHNANSESDTVVFTIDAREAFASTGASQRHVGRKIFRSALTMFVFIVVLVAVPWGVKADSGGEYVLDPGTFQLASVNLEPRSRYAQAATRILTGKELVEGADYVGAMAKFLCAADQLEPAYWSSQAVFAFVRATTLLSEEAYARAREMAGRECGAGFLSADNVAADAAPAAQDRRSLWQRVYFGPGEALIDLMETMPNLFGLPPERSGVAPDNPLESQHFAGFLAAAVWLSGLLMAIYFLEYLREASGRGRRRERRPAGATRA
jgi:hypothetical protein